MRSANDISRFRIATARRGPLLTAALLWGVAILGAFAFLVFDGGLGANLGRFYLVPWAIGAAVVVLAPGAYLYYTGEFDLFHPLVFCVWSYIFPAFVIGALIITFDLANGYVMLFVTDPEYTLPLSLVYITIGFLGVIAGYRLPTNRFILDRITRFSPKFDWDLERVWFPGALLTVSGIGINIFGVILGVLGFQRVDQSGEFDSAVIFFSYLFSVGYVLLWLGVFKTRRRDGLFFLIVGFLVLMIPLRQALQGGRSSLMISVISIAFAYWYSGRRPKMKQTLVFAAVLAVAIFFGIIYGTTFRNLKGSDERLSGGDYIGQIAETVDFISRRNPALILADGLQDLSERVENLSSLAVVVSNYEKLEPYEESYGLKDNIVNDLLTSFVPRVMWPEKPNTSDARAYGELYFSYNNAFAITPFGDLLRNFGVIGIPLGMMVIGIYFRLLYGYLIDTPEPRIWKTIAYYPLLTAVSFEAFYATIFPIVLRMAAVIVVAIIFVNFFARRAPAGDARRR